MAGLIGIGKGMAEESMGGMKVGADANHARVSAQKQLENAERNAKAGMIGQGVGAGAQFAMTEKGQGFIKDMASRFGGGDAAASAAATTAPVPDALTSLKAAGHTGLNPGVVAAGSGDALATLKAAGHTGLNPGVVAAGATAPTTVGSAAIGAETAAATGASATLSAAMPWIAGAFLLAELF